MASSSAKLLGAVTVLAAMTAGRARADIKDFINYCLVGSVSTCASVQVQTVSDGNGGTNVWVRVRNLQGTSSADNTGGSLLTAIGLTAPPITNATNLVVTTSGSVGVFGDPASHWEIRNSPIGGLVEFSAATMTGGRDNSAVEGGIRGCDPAAANPTNWFQTCGPSAGWVVFSFHTSNSWSANDAQIAWKVQSTAITGQSYECRTGDLSGDHLCQPPNVVPEPVTMVLLGSGLAGMGGVGLFRRRKQNGDVENV